MGVVYQNNSSRSKTCESKIQQDSNKDLVVETECWCAVEDVSTVAIMMATESTALVKSVGEYLIQEVRWVRNEEIELVACA